MPFKSAKGKDSVVSKLLKISAASKIGLGLGGGGAGGGVRFAGFNPEPATINNNGTPVGVTTDAWTQLSYTNGGYYENESPGRYFDISVRTPDAGGGPLGSKRSGSISGTVYIEKDSQIFFRTISGGSPGGGPGAAIVNTNALEPETDRPAHTLLVAGGRGANSPNQAQRSGGFAGGSRYNDDTGPTGLGNAVGNGSPAPNIGGGGGNQFSVGSGQGGLPAPNSGSPGNVWTGGNANSGGAGRSGGGGGGWYGGGGGSNSGPGGPWGGGGGGSAYYATPSVSITNPQGLFVEIPAITDTTNQTTFANGTFFEGSGFYYQHRDYPGDQAATTVYIRIAE
jgi:hypothetical protein